MPKLFTLFLFLTLVHLNLAEQDIIQQVLSQLRESKIQKHFENIPDSVMEHEFNIYDQDKDGFLNESEMQAYLKEMQYKTLYNQLDLNQDHRINFHEFVILQYKEMENFLSHSDL